MSVKIFITIDTEEDNWGDYAAKSAVENISQLPKLQNLLNKYNAIPTYLINYPVASSKSSVAILTSILEKEQCEIGMHCHPWNTPPCNEEKNRHNSMMCNLPYELLLEKLVTLHNTIKSNLDVSPTSFRAGRWGLNEDVAKCIEELGYKIDTSITPFVDWSKNEGPNFMKANTQIYKFNSNDIITSVLNGNLIEVPPTIGFFQRNFELSSAAYSFLKKPIFSKFHLLGILDRLHILNFHWLSPEVSSGEEMITLAKRFVALGHGFLNMSFHSTCMLPGKSPFVKNEQDLTIFMNRIETFLKYAVENNFEFLPLAESEKLLS